MAAAVLGKRSRRVLDAEEDLAISPPASKRRTRRSTPQIYEDSGATNTSQTLEDAVSAKAASIRPRTRSGRRHVSAKGTVQDEPVKKHTTAPNSNDECVSAVSDGNAAQEVSTPTTVRYKDVFNGTPGTPGTPKRRVRPVGQLLTPRSPHTPTSPRLQSIYAAARQLFSQSGHHGKLIGREAERAELTAFISEAVNRRTGASLYVSGPPGTGKSALVQEVFEGFQGRDDVNMAVVNCVALGSSSDVLGKLSEQFCGTSSRSSNRTSAKATLAHLFTSKAEADAKTYLVLLDEVDSLLDGDCDVLYSLFEWALHQSSSLVLIGIANALDLTDRFLPRLKTRNLQPRLLPFHPYTAGQIAVIITQKLRSLLPAVTTAAPDFVPVMHPAAIQLCSKKIASQTGDLRKAFNLVRRTIDQVEHDTLVKMSREGSVTPTKQPLSELSNMVRHLPPSALKSSPFKVALPQPEQRTALSQLTAETASRASIAHVAKLASSIFNNGTLSRLAGLNLQQKAVLCSLIASERRQNERDPFKTPSKTGARIATVKDLFEKYSKLCRRDDGLLQPLKTTEFRDVVASLETLGLVFESTGRTSSLLTPTSTSARMNRNADDRQVVSAVSEKEMRDSLVDGPGSELLQRLMRE